MKKIFCYLFGIVIVINLLACYVPVYAATMISTITVEGVTAPKVGEQPKTEGIHIKESGVKIEYTGWMVDGGINLSEGDVFEVGKEYSIYIQISAVSGYSLDSSLDYNRISVNAKDGLLNGENGIFANIDEENSNSYVKFTYFIPNPSKERTISFIGGDGEGTMDDVEVNVGDTYTLPECGFKAPFGQRFSTWYLNSPDKALAGVLKNPGDVITIKENVTVEALWESNGMENMDKAEYDGYDQDHIINYFEITGIKKPKAGENWSVNGISIKATSKSGKDLSSVITLKPQWENKTQQFVMQSGEKFVEGYSYLLYIQLIIDDQYAFSSSTTYKESEKADSVEAYLDNNPSDIRLSYKIEDPAHANEYLISFSPSDGKGAKEPVYVKENSTFTVPENPFTAPDGYKFDKWYVDGVFMNPGDTFIVKDDTLLVASWKVDPNWKENSSNDNNNNNNNNDANNKTGWFANYQGDDFYKDEDGNVRCYDSSGKPVIDNFKCDGEFTYYFQADGTAMKDRLTYHPDGDHVIYFDSEGHEVFSDFANVKKTISGEDVNDFCFFNVFGYLYVDVLTYDKEGKNLYYANPYGVMEMGKWFQFSDTVEWADGTPAEGIAGGYGYANEDGTLLTNTATYDWEGRSCYLQGNGVAAY